MKKAMRKKSGQDSTELTGKQKAGGHAGRGQTGNNETGGTMAPTTKKPANEVSPSQPAGEYRGSEFQSRRAAAHKVST